VTLSNRDRKIIVFVAPVLVVLAYWFLLLSPKRQEASTASEELTKQEQRLDAAKAVAGLATQAKDGFSADYTQVVRLGKAIPSQVDMPGVLVQLDRAAAGTGIRFTKIQSGPRQSAPAPVATTPPSTGSESGASGAPVAAGGETAQSAPGQAAESANDAQQTANQESAAAEQSGVAPSDTQTSTSSGGGLPVGGGAATPGATVASTAPAGLETVPLELEFVGNFFNLADFFHRVKRFVRVSNDNVVVSGRLITIDAVNWSSDPEIFPRVRAELTATIYVSPQAQGTTAGASPTGPAPTDAPPTTTPAESAPAPAAPAPTATATP
jgi:Tfp pilus assembly protein PilO